MSVYVLICTFMSVCVCGCMRACVIFALKVSKSQCFPVLCMYSTLHASSLLSLIAHVYVPSMTYVDMPIIQYYCRKISYLTMPLPLLPFSVFWRTVP